MLNSWGIPEDLRVGEIWRRYPVGDKRDPLLYIVWNPSQTLQCFSVELEVSGMHHVDITAEGEISSETIRVILVH